MGIRMKVPDGEKRLRRDRDDRRPLVLFKIFAAFWITVFIFALVRRIYDILR
jgi:hypothetical protein